MDIIVISVTGEHNSWKTEKGIFRQKLQAILAGFKKKSDYLHGLGTSKYESVLKELCGNLCPKPVIFKSHAIGVTFLIFGT